MQLEGVQDLQCVADRNLSISSMRKVLTNVLSMQIHGHVCMNAVMVTEQLDWRLGGFDLLSEHVAPAGNLTESMGISLSLD